MPTTVIGNDRVAIVAIFAAAAVALVARVAGTSPDDNYSTTLGVKPSIYRLRPSTYHESREPKSDLLPEHLWRTLIPWKVERLAITTESASVRADRAYGDAMDAFRFEPTDYALRKRDVLRDMKNGTPLRYIVDLNEQRHSRHGGGATVLPSTRNVPQPPRVYIFLDRRHYDKIARRENTVGEYLDFDRVACGKSNVGGGTLYLIEDIAIVRSTVELLLRRSFVHWCIKLHVSGKNCYTLVEAASVDDDYAPSPTSPPYLGARFERIDGFAEATVDERGIALSNDVAWFVRWHELDGTVRRAFEKSLYETKFAGAKHAKRDDNPASSTVVFKDRESELSVRTVSLRDVLVTAMGDYVGAIVANDSVAEPFPPFCYHTEIGDEAIELLPDEIAAENARVRDYVRATEQCSRLGLTIVRWSDLAWPRLETLLLPNNDDAATVSSSSSSSSSSSERKRRRVRALGEATVDLLLGFDALHLLEIEL